MPDVHRRAQPHSHALRHVFVLLKKWVNMAKYLPDHKDNSAASTQRLPSKKTNKQNPPHTLTVCACTCVSAPAVCNSWLLLPQLTQITNGEVWMNSSRAEKRKFYSALSPKWPASQLLVPEFKACSLKTTSAVLSVPALNKEMIIFNSRWTSRVGWKQIHFSFVTAEKTSSRTCTETHPNGPEDSQNEQHQKWSESTIASQTHFQILAGVTRVFLSFWHLPPTSKACQQAKERLKSRKSHSPAFQFAFES